MAVPEGWRGERERRGEEDNLGERAREEGGKGREGRRRGGEEVDMEGNGQRRRCSKAHPTHP